MIMARYVLVANMSIQKINGYNIYNSSCKIKANNVFLQHVQCLNAIKLCQIAYGLLGKINQYMINIFLIIINNTLKVIQQSLSALILIVDYLLSDQNYQTKLQLTAVVVTHFVLSVEMRVMHHLVVINRRTGPKIKI